MNHLTAAAIYIAALLLFAACSPESSSYISQRPVQNETIESPKYDKLPEQTFSWVTLDGGQSQLDFNPQLDILFVTDNSESMKGAQENLFKNMDKFTRSITKNKMIDYHVGVISTWDGSEAYIKANQKYGIGELRYIKDGKGQSYNRRFAIKTDSKDILASTLKIGAVPLAQGGPENEEFFAPLSAAIQKTGRGAANEEFFRDNAQLVVIFLTDADDSASSDPKDIVKELIAFKGGRKDKVSIYGVLVNKNDADETKDWALRVHVKYHPECFKKEGKNNVKIKGCGPFGPERIEASILEANKYDGTPAEILKKFIVNINSANFGTELGSVGDSISIKTLRKEIFLGNLAPRSVDGKPLIKVSYGKQVINQGKGGWLYNAENNSVVLSGDIDYQYVEGAKFTVQVSPLTY